MSGGSSLGFSRSESHSETRDLTPKQYTRQRGFVASQLHNQTLGDVPGISGPFVAPLSDAENSALGAFQQSAFGAGGLGQAADDQIRATLSDPNSNPFLKAMIDASIRPILQNAQLQELRDRASFTGTGQKIQGSSAFAEDRMRANRDTEQTVANIATTLAFNERTNQLKAVELANSRLAEQREGISALALPRLIEQLGIDKGNAELTRRYTVMEQALQSLAQLTQPNLGSFSRSYGNAFNTSSSGGFMGGGGGGGGGSTSAGGGGVA